MATDIKQRDYDLQHYAVALPFEVFTPAAMSVGIEIWTWLIEERPDLEMALAVEIERAWMETIASRRGIFSTHLKYVVALTCGASAHLVPRQLRKPVLPRDSVHCDRQGGH